MESLGKSVLTSAITAGITQGAGFNGDMSKMQGAELYGTMAGKELISSTVTGVMDGQDAGEFLGSFATNFAGGFVSHKIGDLGVKYGLDDGSIPKAFLHGAVSGALSSINGGEFGIGFTSGAIGATLVWD